MLKIIPDSKGHIEILHLFGDISIEATNELELSLKKLIDLSPEVIALDFNKVEYIDSSGINSLLKMAKKMTLDEIEFVLYDLNETVVKFFQVSKLDKFLNIVSKSEFEDGII